ncbi:MAG: hypothetical protein A2143_09235 [Gallionellales bacterium RBG_16_57_15]|nr:MAG: hypothetical protein A2143_09235 [Gallionellales bacterium RBG_16_57_15]
MKGIQDQEYTRQRVKKQDERIDTTNKREDDTAAKNDSYKAEKQGEIDKWIELNPEFGGGQSAPASPPAQPQAASGVTAPQIKPRPELNQVLDLQSRMALVDLKYGKTEGVIALSQMLKKMKDEGVTDSLQLMKEGRDQEAFGIFNSTGNEKLEFVSAQNGIYVTPTGDKVPTRLVTARRADGSTTIIDTAETELRIGKAEGLVKMSQAGRKATVDERDVGAKEKAARAAVSGGLKPTDLMQNVGFIKQSIPGIDEREAISIAQGKSDTFATTADMLGGGTLVNKTTGETWAFDRNGKQTAHSPAKATLRNPALGGVTPPPVVTPAESPYPKPWLSQGAR